LEFVNISPYMLIDNGLTIEIYILGQIRSANIIGPLDYSQGVHVYQFFSILSKTQYNCWWLLLFN
jgi:hypothetical protein